MSTPLHGWFKAIKDMDLTRPPTDKDYTLKQLRFGCPQEAQYDNIGEAITRAVYDNEYGMAIPVAILCKGKTVLDSDDLLRLCNNLADALDV